MTTNMTIEDKLTIIKGLIAKVETDTNYSNKIMLPEDMSMEEFVQYAKDIINNTTNLLKPNRMENLQAEEYEETYASVQSLLDGVLTKFPEYIPSEAVRHI